MEHKQIEKCNEGKINRAINVIKEISRFIALHMTIIKILTFAILWHM